MGTAIASAYGQKHFDFSQTVICNACGAYGRYEVFMTYTALALFFIPCFRWNKRYYVRTTCCGMLYELDPEIGKRIARGERLEITPANLRPVRRSGQYYGQAGPRYRRCSYCGFETTEDFEYCPKCGRRFHM
ncbi:MAG: zinc ribbon domain-containing protein [Clostridiales bacterium]|nr:zinc ribbon domain-containing protein [Clostridiales bacterium]